MKIAVFSDIHGNISFFEAFLRDAQAENVEKYVFLGDAVSYYPFGCEVIRMLRNIGALCIEGNHDSMLRGEFPIPEKHEPVYQLRKTAAAYAEGGYGIAERLSNAAKEARGIEELFETGKIRPFSCV